MQLEAAGRPFQTSRNSGRDVGEQHFIDDSLIADAAFLGFSFRPSNDEWMQANRNGSILRAGGLRRPSATPPALLTELCLDRFSISSYFGRGNSARSLKWE